MHLVSIPAQEKDQRGKPDFSHFNAPCTYMELFFVDIKSIILLCYQENTDIIELCGHLAPVLTLKTHNCVVCVYVLRLSMTSSVYITCLKWGKNGCIVLFWQISNTGF